MKGGLAVIASLLDREAIGSGWARVGAILYAGEEGPIEQNDLRAAAGRTGLLGTRGRAGDPVRTDRRRVEVGCVGTINLEAVFQGEACHSARPWLGRSAIPSPCRGSSGSSISRRRSIDIQVYTLPRNRDRHDAARRHRAQRRSGRADRKPQLPFPSRLGPRAGARRGPCAGRGSGRGAGARCCAIGGHPARSAALRDLRAREAARRAGRSRRGPMWRSSARAASRP